MLKAVRRYIHEHTLVASGDHVIVAVSGGGDSVALALILSELAPQLGVSLSLACIDHGLRPESAAEAQWVESLAQSLGVPFDGERLQGLTPFNVQANARDARYEALHRMRVARGGASIATGHTLNDQAETVLARALNGSGLAGLAGIQPKRADGVIRPLLAVQRSDLRTFLRGRGQPWMEDPSNDSERFERVRARTLLAQVERDWPRATAHLAHLAEDARAGHLALQSRSRAWLARAQGRKGLRISVLNAVSRGVCAAVLRRWLRDETQRVLARSHTHALQNLLRTGRGEVLLGDGWGVCVRDGWLVLDRRKRRTRSSSDLP